MADRKPRDHRREQGPRPALLEGPDGADAVGDRALAGALVRARPADRGAARRARRGARSTWRRCTRWSRRCCAPRRARPRPARYRRWRRLDRLDRPLVVLIGGTTGVGKSTLAAMLAARLGVNRVIATDVIRQVLRAFFTHEAMPTVHGSAFEVGGIAGYRDQAERVGTGIAAIVERAAAEGKPVVVEGVHVVPGRRAPARARALRARRGARRRGRSRTCTAATSRCGPARAPPSAIWPTSRRSGASRTTSGSGPAPKGWRSSTTPTRRHAGAPDGARARRRARGQLTAAVAAPLARVPRPMTVLQRKELESSPLADLHAIASELGLEGFRSKRKGDLIGAILDAQGGEEEPSEPVKAEPEQSAAAAEPDEEPEPDEVPSEETLEGRPSPRRVAGRGRASTSSRRSPRSRTRPPTRRSSPAASTSSPTARVSCAWTRPASRAPTCTSRPPRSAAASCAQATRSAGPCARRAATSAIRP